MGSGAAVPIVSIVVGLVALIQGVAWLGPRRGAPRGLAGAALAGAGLVVVQLGLLMLAAPKFFT